MVALTTYDRISQLKGTLGMIKPEGFCKVSVIVVLTVGKNKLFMYELHPQRKLGHHLVRDLGPVRTFHKVS